MIKSRFCLVISMMFVFSGILLVEEALAEENYKFICISETVGKWGGSKGTFGFSVTESEMQWRGYGTIGGGSPGVPIGYMLGYFLSHPGKILQFPIQPGDKWQDGWPGYSTTTEIKIAVESVTVPAGTFKDCLEIETRIATTDEVEDTEEKINAYCGTKRLWLVKAVGLVKMQYEHNDGSVTEALLIGYDVLSDGVHPLKTNYDVPSNDENYYPLEPGSEWSYYWHNDQYAYGLGVQEKWSLMGQATEPLKLNYRVSVLDEYRLMKIRCKLQGPVPNALGLEMDYGWRVEQHHPEAVFGLAAKDFNGNELPIFGEHQIRNRVWLAKDIPPEGLEYFYYILPRQNEVFIGKSTTLSQDFCFVFGESIFITPQR